jgi:hypothetical protein
MPGAQIQPWCASRRFACEVSEVDPHESSIRVQQRPGCCGPRVRLHRNRCPETGSVRRRVHLICTELWLAPEGVQPEVARAGVRIEREDRETGARPIKHGLVVATTPTLAHAPVTIVNRPRCAAVNNSRAPRNCAGATAAHGATLLHWGVQRCSAIGAALLRCRAAVLGGSCSVPRRSRSVSPRSRSVSPRSLSVPSRVAQRSWAEREALLRGGAALLNRTEACLREGAAFLRGCATFLAGSRSVPRRSVHRCCAGAQSC